MPKLLSMAQIMKKKYTLIENLPEKFRDSFGELSMPFVGIIWGQSGQGKTNLVFTMIDAFLVNFKVLFLSLEEGHEMSMKNSLVRHFESGADDKLKNLKVSDSRVTFDELCVLLKKKRSANIIVVDSLQFFNITYDDYKMLKGLFPKKSFLFISHAKGKTPKGGCADSIMYDAGLKIRVDGYIAFPISRYGGNIPYVIWEDGAKQKHGKAYRQIIKPIKKAKIV